MAEQRRVLQTKASTRLSDLKSSNNPDDFYVAVLFHSIKIRGCELNDFSWYTVKGENTVGQVKALYIQETACKVDLVEGSDIPPDGTPIRFLDFSKTRLIVFWTVVKKGITPLTNLWNLSGRLQASAISNLEGRKSDYPKEPGIVGTLVWSDESLLQYVDEIEKRHPGSSLALNVMKRKGSCLRLLCKDCTAFKLYTAGPDPVPMFALAEEHLKTSGHLNSPEYLKHQWSRLEDHAKSLANDWSVLLAKSSLCRLSGAALVVKCHDGLGPPLRLVCPVCSEWDQRVDITNKAQDIIRSANEHFEGKDHKAMVHARSKRKGTDPPVDAAPAAKKRLLNHETATLASLSASTATPAIPLSIIPPSAIPSSVTASSPINQTTTTASATASSTAAPFRTAPFNTTPTNSATLATTSSISPSKNTSVSQIPPNEQQATPGEGFDGGTSSEAESTDEESIDKNTTQNPIVTQYILPLNSANSALKSICLHDDSPGSCLSAILTTYTGTVMPRVFCAHCPHFIIDMELGDGLETITLKQATEHIKTSDHRNRVLDHGKREAGKGKTSIYAKQKRNCQRPVSNIPRIVARYHTLYPDMTHDVKDHHPLSIKQTKVCHWCAVKRYKARIAGEKVCSSKHLPRPRWVCPICKVPLCHKRTSDPRERSECWRSFHASEPPKQNEIEEDDGEWISEESRKDEDSDAEDKEGDNEAWEGESENETSEADNEKEMNEHDSEDDIIVVV